MEYSDTDQIQATSVVGEDYYSRFTGEEIDARLAEVMPHVGNSTIHIQQAERDTWNFLSDLLVALKKDLDDGKYTKTYTGDGTYIAVDGNIIKFLKTLGSAAYQAASYFATATHNHDGVYSQVGHSHSQYLTSRGYLGTTAIQATSKNQAVDGVTSLDGLIFFDKTNWRVGVSTESPEYELHINGFLAGKRLVALRGSGDQGGKVYLQGGGSNKSINIDQYQNYFRIYADDSPQNAFVIDMANFRFKIGSAGGGGWMRWDSSKNALVVEGNVLATGDVASYQNIGGTSEVANMKITEKLTTKNIDASGKVKAAETETGSIKVGDGGSTISKIEVVGNQLILTMPDGTRKKADLTTLQ